VRTTFDVSELPAAPEIAIDGARVANDPVASAFIKMPNAHDPLHPGYSQMQGW
jgi:hypothetical protein